MKHKINSPDFNILIHSLIECIIDYSSSSYPEPLEINIKLKRETVSLLMPSIIKHLKNFDKFTYIV